MIDSASKVREAAALCAALSLAACTGGVHSSGSSSGTASEPQYTLGGTVSGLSGSGLVLASNTGETVNVSADGTFSFKTTFPDGSPYYVLVLTQPNTPTQTCVANNGSGTIQSSNVTGITVSCKTKTTPTDTIGGVVVGLTGSGLVLQNGSDTVAVTANGSFVFPTAVPSGAQYSVSVLTPPIKPYEDCAVLNGQGTTGSSDVTNIGIVCTVNSSATHTISGTITGVTGTIVLENNGRDDLTLTADGAFKFPLPIPSGSSYDVTTKSATGVLSQACTFANATGMVGDSDISNVAITCVANGDLAAVVSGLAGSGLTLRNSDNADTVTVTSNGTVVFPTGLAAGGAYNVTITAQPTNPAQTCVVGNGAGTAPETTPVTVTCTINPTYTVTGTVSGLSGTGLTLQNTGDGDTLQVTANGTVTFPSLLGAGQAYSIAVSAQPTNPTQTCVVGNSSGTAPETTVVTVTCTTNTYTLGGAVTGLPGPQPPSSGPAPLSLVLQDSVGDTVTLPASSPSPVAFTFPTPIPSGSTYSVAVRSQPGTDLTAGQGLQTSLVCVVSAGTGTVTNANIANVVITCVQPGGFAYVTNGSDNTISAYVIDGNTGALLPSGPPVSTGTFPTSVVPGPLPINPTGTNFLYVTNGGSSDVSGYTVDPNTGSLTPLAGSPFTIGGSSAPTSIAAAPGPPPNYNEYTAGNWLYTTNQGGHGLGTISAASYDGASGALTDITGTPFPTGFAPTSAQFLAGGNYPTFLNFLLEIDGGTLSSFVVNNSTGAPQTPAAGSAATGNAPTSVAALAVFVPTQESYFNYAYVVNSGDGTLSSYQINDQSGALTASVTTPLETGASAVAVAGNYETNPNYVFATSPRGIWGFSAANDGTLTALPGNPVAAGAGPGPVVANDQYVYVVNTTDETISAYAIQDTVDPLLPVTGPMTKTGHGPNSIVVIPRPAFD